MFGFLVYFINIYLFKLADDDEFIDNEEQPTDDISVYHNLHQQLSCCGQDKEESRNEETTDEEEEEVDEQDIIYPIKVTKCEMDRHINLLVTENDGALHYTTVINFSRLVEVQYTKHDGKHFYCYSCLHGFAAKTGEKHAEIVNCCKMLKPHVSYQQGEDTKPKFKNIQTQLKVPFICYADFECILKKVGSEAIDTTTGIVPPQPPTSGKLKSKEIAYQVHEAASYAYKIASIDPDYKFELEQMRTSSEPFANTKDEKKVRDHCHIQVCLTQFSVCMCEKHNCVFIILFFYKHFGEPHIMILDDGSCSSSSTTFGATMVI